MVAEVLDTLLPQKTHADAAVQALQSGAKARSAALAESLSHSVAQHQQHLNQAAERVNQAAEAAKNIVQWGGGIPETALKADQTALQLFATQTGNVQALNTGAAVQGEFRAGCVKAQTAIGEMKSAQLLEILQQPDKALAAAGGKAAKTGRMIDSLLIEPSKGFSIHNVNRTGMAVAAAGAAVLAALAYAGYKYRSGDSWRTREEARKSQPDNPFQSV